jgi:hypothetical protein
MAETLLFEERTLEGFSDTGSGYRIYAEQLTLPAFTAGETYRVLWDGTEYNCLAETFEGSVFIGNVNIIGLDYGTGEPFLMGVGNQDGQETFMCATTQEETSHTVSIYRKEKELPSADIKIKGYSGTKFTYEKVPKVYLAAPESTTDNPVLVPFTYGEAIEGVEVEPDFSDGDMQITAPDGYLIRSGVVKKPETLVPENVKSGAEVAGITGTYEGIIPETEEKTVDADFSEGDMEIEPAEGKYLSKTTVVMPETLLPENIADGVDIAGIIGTLAGGKALWATGTIDETKSNVTFTVEHNLGVIPDIVIVRNKTSAASNFQVFSIGFSRAFASKCNMYNFIATVYYNSSMVAKYAGYSNGIDDANTTLPINTATETTFGVSAWSPQKVEEGSTWIAIGGLT